MVPFGVGDVSEETMRERVPRCAKIWASSTQKLTRNFTVSDDGQHVNSQKVRILAAAKDAGRTRSIKEDAPCHVPVHSTTQQAGSFWPLLRNARRNRFGDPKYHSGRKKKELASPYLEFLDKLEKAARKMPQPYEFDLLHAAGIRHPDLDAGVSVLNEVIHECHRSLEAIGHAELDLDARSWARGQGLRE